jgi:hypothetical protein
MSFTRWTRDGQMVTKQLTDPDLPQLAAFASAMGQGGAPALERYLATLREAGVRLPAALTVTGSGGGVVVRHRWVRCPTLPEILATDPGRAVAAAARVQQWCAALDGHDARVDTNLGNICCCGDQPVLIDVLPPLIPSLRPDITGGTVFDVLFDALCFDTAVTRVAFAGYLARALLRAGHHDAAADVCHQAPAPSPVGGDTVGGLWFGMRLAAARAVATRRAPMATLTELCALTSLHGLAALTPAAQTARITTAVTYAKERL